MKFGSMTGPIKAPIEEKLDHIKALGMDVWHPASKEVEGEDLAKIKDLLVERDLGISAMSAGVRMSHPDKKEANLEAWKKSIQMAVDLDIEVVISRTFPKDEGVSDDDAWKSCVEVGNEMGKIAADNGRIFAFETDHFNFIDTLAGTQKLLEAIPTMMINFDPCNFRFGGSTPKEVIEAVSDRIVHGHIKDMVMVDGEPKESPVGEGELDYEWIFSELIRRGFEGAMCIEHCKEYECVDAAWAHIQSVRAKLGI